MKGESYTVIVVPQRSSLVKRYKLTSRHLKFIASLFLLINIGLFFLIKDYIQIKYNMETSAPNIRIENVEEELNSAKAQMRTSLDKANQIMLGLIGTVEMKNKELIHLVKRYKELEPLVADKEELVGKYRDILQAKRWQDKVWEYSETIFLGIVVFIFTVVMTKVMKRVEAVNETDELREALKHQFGEDFDDATSPSISKDDISDDIDNAGI